MSDAEHLIENAIMALELYPYEEAERYFMEAPINIMMANDSGCPLNAVWEMAIYCDTTLRQDWNEKWEKEAEQWIPVTERKPEHDDIVIAFFPEMRGTECSRQIQKGWSVKLKFCSHWMPLPEEPKEEHNAKENSI